MLSYFHRVTRLGCVLETAIKCYIEDDLRRATLIEGFLHLLVYDPLFPQGGVGRVSAAPNIDLSDDMSSDLS